MLSDPEVREDTPLALLAERPGSFARSSIFLSRVIEVRDKSVAFDGRGFKAGKIETLEKLLTLINEGGSVHYRDMSRWRFSDIREYQRTRYDLSL